MKFHLSFKPGDHSAYIRLLICIITFICCICASCEFEPEGSYKVNVNKITEAPSLVVQLNFDTDTIYIPLNINAKLAYSTSDSLVRYASFTLNNEEIITFEGNGNFAIGFSTSGYKINTPYILRVNLYRSTGSGSLADKVRREGFLYSKKYIVFFTETDITPQITSLKIDSGKLKICWEKFHGLSFKQYDVIVSNSRTVAIIKSQQTDFCYDNFEFGRGGSFYIVTETENSTFYSRNVILNPDLPSIQIENVDETRIKLVWEKSKFYSKIKGYRLYEEIPHPQLKYNIGFFTDSQDTSIIFEKARFAVGIRFSLEVVPKDTSYYYSNSSITETIEIGEPKRTDFFDAMSFPLGKYGYVGYGQNGFLSKYNIESQLFEDSVKISSYYNNCSADGKLLLSINSDNLTLINAESMQIIESFSPEKFPFENRLPVRFLIGNNGIGVLIFDANFYFYDFLHHIVLKKFNTGLIGSFYSEMILSPDGKYFGISGLYETSLYHYENDSVSMVWKDQQGYLDIDYVNNSLVFFKSGQLRNMSFNDLKISVKRNLGTGFIYDIDWYNREVLYLNSNRDMLSIIGMDDGIVKKVINTYDFGNFYHWIHLINKTLYVRDRILKLNY
jgi:hypothetical protein